MLAALQRTKRRIHRGIEAGKRGQQGDAAATRRHVKRRGRARAFENRDPREQHSQPPVPGGHLGPEKGLESGRGPPLRLRGGLLGRAVARRGRGARGGGLALEVPEEAEGRERARREGHGDACGTRGRGATVRRGGVSETPRVSRICRRFIGASLPAQR